MKATDRALQITAQTIGYGMRLPILSFFFFSPA